MSKRNLSLMLALLLATFAVNALFSQSLTIDEAIRGATADITKTVPKNTKIAVVNVSTEFTELSNYVINELIAQLVNTHSFRVLPRGEVETNATKRELNFQMSGYVSDESAKSLGKFLGAGTIITGTIAQDSTNTFRITINAIDVEAFTYQTSYRSPIKYDSQVKQLIAGTGKTIYEDYSVGERLGTGAVNIFFGLGSALQGDKRWKITAVVEGVGVAALVVGLLITPVEPTPVYVYDGRAHYKSDTAIEDYELQKSLKSGFTIAGAGMVGAGVVIGFITPFFYHKPNNNKISLINPDAWNIELVSSKGETIDGFKLAYTVKY
jgi:TolB-like protein